MNPASRKNPLDGAKFRENYLSNLRLQASNDQKNQNANQIFKNTGQTPSRPPDSRTTTEKAGDMEGMKVDLRSKLGTITDGVIASQIIGELTADQIRFAIDKWGTIEPDMRKQFSSGVPTSAFIAYLNRLIEKFQITDGVETGLQQSRALLMSNTQILYGLPRGQIWGVLKNTLGTASRQFGLNVAPALEAIAENENILPNIQQSQVIERLPPELKSELSVLANRMYNNVASNAEISDLIEELQIGLANRSVGYTQKAIQKATTILTLDDSVYEDRDRIIELVNTFLEQGVQDDAFAIEGGDNEEPQVILQDELRPEEEIFSSPKPAEPEAGKKADKTYDDFLNEAPVILSQAEWAKLGKKNKVKKAIFLNARLKKNPEITLHKEKILPNGRIQLINEYQFPRKMIVSDKVSNDDLDSIFNNYMSQTNLGMSANGLGGRMSGCGLAKPKVDKPYRQSIAHLVDKPIEKPKPYTQFGRYFINKHRLEGEGICAFRQPSGNTIPNLPTEKVSRPLAKVMTTLVGKGIPSYEDIATLSPEDKTKLRHFCKSCRVDSPAIPKMKGEGEQEEDRFNILRGEIIAGNDSPKIAKEFKVMLMKFVAEGRIPKRQANEILHELLALGH